MRRRLAAFSASVGADLRTRGMKGPGEGERDGERRPRGPSGEGEPRRGERPKRRPRAERLPPRSEMGRRAGGEVYEWVRGRAGGRVSGAVGVSRGVTHWNARCASSLLSCHGVCTGRADAGCE